MNDEVTILRAQKGNEAAFRKLYEGFRMQVFKWASRYTNSAEDTEDILQETFIKAFKNIQSLQNVSVASFGLWLKRICIHTSLNHLRKMKRRKKDHIYSLSNLAIEPESKQDLPEDLVQIQHLYRHIKEALQRLSARQRIIFEMKHSQYKNIREISEMMNCSESNVKAHLSRSMKKLRKELSSLREA